MSAVKNIFKGAIGLVKGILGGEKKQQAGPQLPKIDTTIDTSEADAAARKQASRRGAAANVLAGELEDTKNKSAKKTLLGVK